MQRLLLLILLGIFAGPADAQPLDHEVRLTGWPMLKADGDRYPFDLLPSIDTLALGYEYAVENGMPVLHFNLAWVAGPFGILNERRVPASRMPGDIRLERIELLAGVFVDGERVTDLRIVADSLLLPPTPEAIAFDGIDLDWSTLFTDGNSDDARTYFYRGFVLDSLEIEHIAFAVFEQRAARYEGPPTPPRARVYPVYIDLYGDWFLGGRRIDRYHRGVAAKDGRPSRSVRGTRASSTRSDGGNAGDDRNVIREPVERSSGAAAGSDEDRTKRSGREDRSRVPGRKKSDKKKDEDEDEDDASLVPLAVGAAAAVVVVAVAGGTVGYYGNLSDAPVGLASGYVRPRGGVLMQAAVNGGVLGTSDEPDRVIAKLTGFYDVFGAPVQPTVGVGAVFSAEGDDVAIEPTFSFGAAGNFGPFVVVGAYDVQARGFDLGLAFNFKARRGR